MDERQSKEKRKQKFQKLIKEIRRNPQKGLGQFYEAYAKIMQTTAQIICRSTERANEVVNDVLVKIWKKAKTIDNIDNPEGWIYVITANAAKDTLRERHVFPLDKNILSDEDQIQEVLDKHSFYWMIKDLSETEQMVLIHKFVSLYTFQEIADELGKPLTTVTSIFYRALEKIRIKKNIEEGF